MAENKRYVELIWYQKYDKIKLGEKISIEKPNLSFPTVETVNKSRIKGWKQQFLYPEDKWPENYPKDWKNIFIWGDNKLKDVLFTKARLGWKNKFDLYCSPIFHRCGFHFEN